LDGSFFRNGEFISFYCCHKINAHSFIRIYLRRTASHRPFAEISPAERTADFTAVFGADWRMLDARFTRFMTDVK
jgi:hypothetical protein